MRKRIENAVDAIDEVREAAERKGGGTVETWFLSMPLLYTIHRCDDWMVFVPYRHRPGKEGTVLTQVFKGHSSEIYDFFLDELEWMTHPDNGSSRLYDSGGGKGAQGDK